MRLVVWQTEKLPFRHCSHSPQVMVNGITTRSPTFRPRALASGPTSTTSPMGSWPMTSPAHIVGTSPSKRCRSEPQMQVVVILTIASRGCSILGSGTVSQRMSFLPCQQIAFIAVLLVLRRSCVGRRSVAPR